VDEIVDKAMLQYAQKTFNAKNCGMILVNNPWGESNEKGLTAAEHAAITAYTAEDYKYINPATANIGSWMASSMKANGYHDLLAPAPAKPDGSGHRGGEDQKFGGHRGGEDKEFALSPQELSLKTLREEGSLHAAVATAGLRKLDPFHGFSYRGETTTEADFRGVVPGADATKRNLLSTGKGWTVCLGFAGTNAKGDRDIALMWVFDHRAEDSGGRDVSALSQVATEGEILIMADYPFHIQSVIEVGSPGGRAKAGDFSKYYDAILGDVVMQLARKVYVVHAVAGA